MSDADGFNRRSSGEGKRQEAERDWKMSVNSYGLEKTSIKVGDRLWLEGVEPVVITAADHGRDLFIATDGAGNQRGGCGDAFAPTRTN